MANNITILVRADTAANWESKDSLLRMREIGYDQTNRRFKVGDGTTTWKNLPYVKPDVVNDLLTGGADAALSAEQGKVLSGLINDCAEDIETINQNISNLEQNITQIVADGLPKVVDKLEEANSGTDALSAKQGWILNGLIPSIEDNLTSDSTTSALSAKQGKELKRLVDGKTSVAVINSLTSTSTTNALSAAQGKALNDKVKNYRTESWTFTLEDGSTVPKTVVLSL